MESDRTSEDVTDYVLNNITTGFEPRPIEMVLTLERIWRENRTALTSDSDKSKEYFDGYCKALDDVRKIIQEELDKVGGDEQ